MVDWASAGRTAENVLSVLANLSFIIYIPVVFIDYRRAKQSELNERRKETQARKDEVYRALWQSYIDWQKLCLEYIDLDIADYPDEEPKELTPTQRKQETLALQILIEIFEQAFLAYLEAPEELRHHQWSGWERYVDDYCQRPNFRVVWDLTRASMDTRFSDFMDTKLGGHGPGPRRVVIQHPGA